MSSKERILATSGIKPESKPAGEHTPESPASGAGVDEVIEPVAPTVDPTKPAHVAGEGDQKPGETLEAYKKRLDDSKREALRLVEENRQKDERIAELEAEAENNADLTLEAQLRKETPEWDVMDESERQAKLETAREKRRNEQLQSENAKLKAEKQFDKAFEDLVLDPKMELLKAQKEDFRKYAVKHPNTDLNVLARAFLYVQHGEHSADEAAERTKRQGLEAPTGQTTADDVNRSDDGYSEDALKVLANSNPREFNRIMATRAKTRQARSIAGHR